jgi:protocatechuate 3,4-dioxygenase alpha subunit
MAKLGQTPSQTVGPYFSMCLFEPGQNVLVSCPSTESRRIRVIGTVYDADRKAMEDALLEVWQSDSEGVYRHPLDGRASARQASPFTGFGRAVIEPQTLEYSFETIKPGSVPAPDGSRQAPHLSVIVQGRGMLRPLFTRAYFGDEPDGNARDLLLGTVPLERRPSLVASPVSGGALPTYRFDIHLQGPLETVFFDFEP